MRAGLKAAGITQPEPDEGSYVGRLHYAKDARLTRIIHEGSSRGGADGHEYKAHLAHPSRRDRRPRSTRQYIEEPEGAQRSRYARIRRRSRSFLNNPG